MASIGYKKKGDSGPLYNPERDYAYITPTLMRIAIENLDNLIATNNTDAITPVEIVKIAECLADAQRDFVNAADPVQSLEQALRRHGFYDFRPCVRRLLFASIGEVCCAAWFTAVREVSVVGEESPASEDMARFTAAVREFAAQHKQAWYDANHMAEHLRMQNDVLQARINELASQVIAVTQQLSAVGNELRKYKDPPRSLFGRCWEEMAQSFGLSLKGNKCPSTGCTKTRHSSGPN